MAKGAQVLEMLIPAGGWIIRGEEFENIEFVECSPITKKQFQDGFAVVDAWLEQREAAKAALIESRRQKLLALGLTEDELNA